MPGEVPVGVKKFTTIRVKKKNIFLSLASGAVLKTHAPKCPPVDQLPGTMVPYDSDEEFINERGHCSVTALRHPGEKVKR